MLPSTPQSPAPRGCLLVSAAGGRSEGKGMQPAQVLVLHMGSAGGLASGAAWHPSCKSTACRTACRTPMPHCPSHRTCRPHLEQRQLLASRCAVVVVPRTAPECIVECVHVERTRHRRGLACCCACCRCRRQHCCNAAIGTAFAAPAAAAQHPCSKVLGWHDVCAPPVLLEVGTAGHGDMRDQPGVAIRQVKLGGDGRSVH